MDRQLDIGRGTLMFSGTVSDCDACDEGRLIIERRYGHVIHAICTNPSCELHPETPCVKNITTQIRRWAAGTGKTIGSTEGDIESLAEFLFENVKF